MAKPIAKKPAAKKPAPKPKKVAPKKAAPSPLVEVKVKSFPLNMLTLTDQMQMRAFPEGQLTNKEHVEDIREAIQKKRTIEPITIYIVPGRGNVVTDGFHTVEAYRLEGIDSVPARIYEGTWLDALKAAAGANTGHVALKRTNADKRNAVVKLLLALREAGESWADTKVAGHVDVSDKTVAAMRLRIPIPLPAPAPPLVSVTGLTPNSKLSEGQISKPVATAPTPTPPVEVREGKDGKSYPAAKPKTPRKPAAYSMAKFEAVFGALYREIDAAGLVYGGKDTPAAEGLRRNLSAWKTIFVAWHDNMKRDHKPS